MSPNVMEAESRKYSNDVIIVLPLSSGKLAVFNAARQLAGIVDTWNDAGYVSIPEIVKYEPPATVPAKLEHLLKGIEL